MYVATLVRHDFGMLSLGLFNGVIVLAHQLECSLKVSSTGLGCFESFVHAFEFHLHFSSLFSRSNVVCILSSFLKGLLNSVEHRTNAY